MRVPVFFLLGVAVATTASGSPPTAIMPVAPPCAGNSLSSPAFGCANADNLRAMIANPADLVQGRASTGSDAIVEAAAVTRYRTDKVKKLRPNSTTVRSSPTSD